MAAPATDDFPYITRFGVELELCVRTDGDCMLVMPPPDKLTELLTQEKFDLYFANLLFPRRTALTGLQKSIAFEDDDGNFYLYDLETGTKTKARMPEEVRAIENYTFVKFMDDQTIVCGDEYHRLPIERKAEA